MEITKEEICLKIVEWLKKQKSITLGSNAVLIKFYPETRAADEFDELISTYNFIVEKEQNFN